MAASKVEEGNELPTIRQVTLRGAPTAVDGDTEGLPHAAKNRMAERGGFGPLKAKMLELLNNERQMSYVYLSTWFALNVVITLYCKAVFSVHHFPYPMMMTVIHLAFTAFGVQICAVLGIFVPKPLNSQNFKTCLWFSVIFTLNIWLSNASLMAVSVNLHQVVRTTIPLFTMAISLFLFGDRYSCSLLPSILTVIVGVSATVWGDMDFTAFGMTIVILGCVLSSLKGILTQKTQVGAMGMSSMDLLRYLSPMAVVELLVMALATGEIQEIRANANLSTPLIGHLSLLGVVAFFLNFVSFRNAALNSPLTLNIAGNVKQVVASLLSIWIFGGILSPALAFGIFVTALGAFMYSHEMGRWRASLREKEAMAVPTDDPDEDLESDSEGKGDLELQKTRTASTAPTCSPELGDTAEKVK